MLKSLLVWFEALFNKNNLFLQVSENYGVSDLHGSVHWKLFCVASTMSG